jgi:hypothetical protein
MATASDAHLFVSVHFNAFPDGVNPFVNHGTVMLFYWDHSLDFARHLQREILAELGLPDRGVRFQDLAIARTSWMPAVLTESMYMMLPEQEAALRDPAVQQRIAAAHFRAMASFLTGERRVTKTAVTGRRPGTRAQRVRTRRPAGPSAPWPPCRRHARCLRSRRWSAGHRRRRVARR